MIGRADIEGSKSDVAMNAWPPQASSCLPVASGATLRHGGERSPCAGAPSRAGVARTLSRRRSVHQHFCERWTGQALAPETASVACPAADCPSSGGFLAATARWLPRGVTPSDCYRRPRRSSPHPSVLGPTARAVAGCLQLPTPCATGGVGVGGLGGARTAPPGTL